MADTPLRKLWVIVTDDGGVWDRDSDQVNEGEVFLSGSQPQECYATTRINEALASGRLKEVSSPSSVPKSPPK